MRVNIRMKFQRIFFSLSILFYSHNYFSQELNCQVDINSSQLQGSTNKQIFDQMKRSIIEFMNNTKWTNDTYATQEKIECSILIIIKSSPAQDDYSGTIQVTSRRPVFKSSYYTEVLNVEDENFNCTFQQFTQLQFNINTYQSNNII